MKIFQVNVCIIYWAVLFLSSCQNFGKIGNNLSYSDKNLFDRHITDNLFNTIRNYHDQSEFAIGLIVIDTIEFYGLRKNKSKVVTISNSKSIFEIGSIKVFLTALLIQSVQDNRITLSENLRTALPFGISSYGFGNRDVQIIYLANHTSGIEPLPEGIIQL